MDLCDVVLDQNRQQELTHENSPAGSPLPIGLRWLVYAWGAERRAIRWRQRAIRYLGRDRHLALGLQRLGWHADYGRQQPSQFDRALPLRVIGQ